MSTKAPLARLVSVAVREYWGHGALTFPGARCCRRPAGATDRLGRLRGPYEEWERWIWRTGPARLKAGEIRA